MSGAYDCNYDFVDDPLSALVEAHAEIRRLEDEHAAEIARLRLAIRRLAEQDATLSVCDGDVTVTMDATLTDAEREAVEFFAELPWAKESGNAAEAAVLRGLLERIGGGR